MNTLQLELMEAKQRLHCEKAAVKTLKARLGALDSGQLQHAGIHTLANQIMQLHERFQDGCERLGRLEALCVVPAVFDPRPQLWQYRKAIFEIFSQQHIKTLRGALDGKIAAENDKLRGLIKHEEELAGNLSEALETQNMLFSKAADLLKIKASSKAHQSANAKLQRLIREQSASQYQFDRNAAFLNSKISQLDQLLSKEAQAQSKLLDVLNVNYFADLLQCAELDDFQHQLEYQRFSAAAGALTRSLKTELKESQGFARRAKDLSSVFQQLGQLSGSNQMPGPALPTDRAVAESTIAHASAVLARQRLLVEAREQLIQRIQARLQELARQFSVEQGK